MKQIMVLPLLADYVAGEWENPWVAKSLPESRQGVFFLVENYTTIAS